MDILFCTSEAYPLIKTGGLADVSGSLAKALLQLEHDIRVVLPAYPAALRQAGELTELAQLKLTGSKKPVRILLGRIPDSEVPLYLIDAPDFFNRTGNPYTQPDGSDWPDNAERFALFAHACVALALGQADGNWRPQLVHCNDWQTGLVPALLSLEPDRPATLFSIHNLAYQGLFPAKTFSTLDLPDELWSLESLEFYNLLSFIKGGIAHADWVTTVSPGYAGEITEDAHGYGLAGLLRHRSDELTGILNGVDHDTWSPTSDPLITRHYDVHTLQNKLFNKFTLQRDLGLSVASQPLMLSYVGRIVEQKGIDLILDIMDELFKHPVQLVILGSGDPELEARLRSAEQHYPRQLSVHIGYDEHLAHNIEAGADALLMPSRYEPCGLNQMYSQLYGTIPIARRTGGLADTIVDFSQQSLAEHRATGFLFDGDTPEALLATCLGAISLYRNHRVDWWKMVIAGMKQDFSWMQSARQYIQLYIQMINNRQAEMTEEHVANIAFTLDSEQSRQLLH